MDLRDYLRILWRRKFVAAAVFAVSLSAMFAYQKTQRRPTITYTATAEVRIEELFTLVDVAGFQYWREEMEKSSRQFVLRSREVIERAVRSLETSHPDYYPAAIWEEPPPEGGPAHLRRQELAALRSRLTVTPDEDSQILQVTFRDSNAERAVETVNAVVTAFKEVALEEARSGLDAMWVQARELEATTRESLDAARGDLRDVGIVVDPTPQLQADLDRLIETEGRRREELRVIDLEARRLQRTAEGAQQLLQRRTLLDEEAEEAPAVTRLAAKLSDLQARIEDLLLRYQPEAPQVLAARRQIEDVQRALTEALGEARRQADSKRRAELRIQLLQVQTDLAALAQDRERIADEVQELASQVDDVRRQLRSGVPTDPATQERLLQRQELEGEISMHQSSLERLAGQRQSIDVQRKFIEEGPVKSVELARDSAPQVAGAATNLILIVLVSLVLAVSTAYALEYMNTTVRTEHDVKRYVNLPLYGAIRKEPEPLLINAAPRSPLSEVFNTVSTLLETYIRETQARVFMVASSNAGEGKSTITSNIATAMARGGKRVLLIDSDLRKAVLHRFFSVDNSEGASTYLMSRTGPTEEPVPFDRIVRPSGVENLWVIPAGPHPRNPVAALKSPGLAELLKEARQKFDVVLVDVPPVRIAVDTLILSPLVDAVMLLISASETNKDEVGFAKRLIESANGKLVGCLLNKTTITSRGYYYYYYYYYYDRYKYYRES